MPKLGILFDIDNLAGGLYGFRAYRLFFSIVDRSALLGCGLCDGDTRATLAGQARHFCIALESPDPERIAALRATVARITNPALLPAGGRFLEESHLRAESLIPAGRVDAAGQLIGGEASWVRAAWDAVYHTAAGRELRYAFAYPGAWKE